MTSGVGRVLCTTVVTGILFTSVALAGDGVVALQTADPSCPVGAGFYFNCGNGTVTDLRTGLVWLQNANCFGGMTWAEAMTTVSGLSDLDCGGTEPDCYCGLEDGSSPGDWRLPSRKESKAMVADARSAGCLFPALTADLGAPCWSPGCVTTGGCSFLNATSAFYWTSSTDVASPEDAWILDLSDGGSSLQQDKVSPNTLLWPVRSGQ